MIQVCPKDMPAIRILPDVVANQIAAGEVIERPVAVVKELVENSIDAGATRIEIEFRNGGKSFIRISDNGKGMPPDEALLSLERHATSKIREAADLNEILSFGFRGEALPSIASVSKFTLRTRAEGWDHGTEIFINGGKLIHKKECGMPVGTVIEVANLFNSVPARRKFLKTDPTETAHITYTTRLFAVAHPEIAFHVVDSGRTVFQSPSCSDLRDRIGEIWGRSLADDLIPVEAEDSSLGFRLSGLTAKPGVGRSTRRELITMINRRPVDSRTLGFAVLDAYLGRIQKGRYPPAFLFFHLSPREVDVNVHPAKREVRFRNDAVVRRFVLGAVSDTLSDAAKPASTEKASVPEVTPVKPQDETVEPTPIKPATTPTPVPRVVPAPQRSSKTKVPVARVLPVAPQPPKETALPETEAEPASAKAPEWKLLCLLKQRYGLFETPRGLVMLHLRHADQRVRFEQILATFDQEEAARQQLLIPIPIEFEPLASEALKTELETLNSHGFEIEEFGRHFYRILSVPDWMAPEQVEAFVRDLVDRFRQRGGSRKDPKLTWELVARLAMEQSYQRNDNMSHAAAQKLAETLLCCETPHTSPSGKPTFSEISWSEWERRFGN
ncbi:DNA mismatch repair endonuclease MutL [Coraliomargarita parva]|uniref:DNA mismatch repair endonuclease MutL n=1 Tax=Coraliomargarita parva TaxID=3014050 RepID=UPI0022B4776F|nr:DNA mismatch repair endonuclease MutL [Coraliomargarita parva]